MLVDRPQHGSRTATLVLGIESSCDETAASVVAGGRLVLSNVIASQHELHQPFGGVVPELASRAHVERLTPVVRAALGDARVSPGQLSAIAVGHRPGLIGALLVGVSAAKALSWSLGVPLLGVDHIHAHLYAGLLRDAASHTLTQSTEHKQNDADELARDITALYPALGLVISGGHTSMYLCESPLRVQLLGRTIDDAVGEAFDKVASILGLGHPGGPLVDRHSAKGNDKAHDFPVGRLTPDSLDFTFSGLKTSVLYAVRGNPQPPAPRRGAPAPEHVEHDAARGTPGALRHAAPLAGSELADVCASFQRAASRAITLKLGRALGHLASRGVTPRALLVGGGVSANPRIRADLGSFADDNHLELRLPPMSFCTDNAAMLAGLAHHRLVAGERDELTLRASPLTTA